MQVDGDVPHNSMATGEPLRASRRGNLQSFSKYFIARWTARVLSVSEEPTARRSSIRERTSLFLGRRDRRLYSRALALPKIEGK